MLNENIGSTDRIIRFAAGVVLAGAGFAMQSPISYVLWGLGAIMFATAAVKICPLYMPFGISTCAKK